MRRNQGPSGEGYEPDAESDVPAEVEWSPELHEAEVLAARQLAATVAESLAQTPLSRWEGSNLYGRHLAVSVFVEDYPQLPKILDEARDLAEDRQRAKGAVWSRPGVSHRVVLAFGDEWSLIAASGGPVLVLPDWSSHILRLDRDPDWQPELASLVGELMTVARELEREFTKAPPLPVGPAPAAPRPPMPRPTRGPSGPTQG